MSKPLKKSGSSRNPALRENNILRMQGKSMSRARIVHPGTRQCPGIQALVRGDNVRGDNVRGDNVRTTEGQNFVRGAGFKATKGQNFVRGVEKHHRQIGT